MIEQRLQAQGLLLPAAIRLPPGVQLSFPWARRVGNRVVLSGHGALEPDGSLAGPFGMVGGEVTPEQAYEAARLTGLAMLSSLKACLGDLDRITAWVRVHGMVNTAPGFNGYPAVLNGFTDLINSLFGSEAAPHARAAIGVAGLPFNMAIEIEGEVAVCD